MRPVLGHEIGQELIDALNLPKHTRSFVLRVESGHMVTVECEYYPDCNGLETALSSYVLCATGGTVRKPKPIDFDAWLAERRDAAHANMLARHRELSRMDARLARA